MWLNRVRQYLIIFSKVLFSQIKLTTNLVILPLNATSYHFLDFLDYNMSSSMLGSWKCKELDARPMQAADIHSAVKECTDSNSCVAIYFEGEGNPPDVNCKIQHKMQFFSCKVLDFPHLDPPSTLDCMFINNNRVNWDRGASYPLLALLLNLLLAITSYLIIRQG